MQKKKQKLTNEEKGRAEYQTTLTNLNFWKKIIKIYLNALNHIINNEK
jgi:hypothetical protein